MTSDSDIQPDNSVVNDHESCLSALLDGTAGAADAACLRWREDPEARRTWHAYHLIGDAMRSEELASQPAHDAAFLVALRLRLAQEPVVLAPASAVSPASAVHRRQVWRMPAAAAAGVVVVAGLLVMTRGAAPDAEGKAGSADRRMAIAERAAPEVTSKTITVLSSAQGPASDAGTSFRGLAAAPVSGTYPVLVRDARLDDYLRAHQAAGGMAAATPGGWLRRVDNRTASSSER